MISERIRPSALALDQVAAYYKDLVHLHWTEWAVNQPHVFEAIFGPREVNLDYYTDWPGDDRIIVLKVDQIRRLKLPVPLAP